MCWDIELNVEVERSIRLELKVELNDSLQLCFIDNVHGKPDWRFETEGEKKRVKLSVIGV